jgi:signal transduction histidine kinase
MMLVWYEGSKGNCVAKFVKSEKEYDYFRIFWLGVPIFLFVLCGMTFIGIRYFVEYIKARDDFLAATAHDLTTPLVGMRMSIGRSDADAKALNERLIRIVENIKDFMRLGGKRREPEISEFDIIKAYNEAYALFREDYRDLFDGEDVPVEVMGTVPENVGTVPEKAGTVPQKAGTVPGGWVLKVRADETMTVQMMWNLLGNDLKYAAPYGPVRVRFFVEGKFVKAEFVDEGQGMTPRQMRRAFDRYYRAKTVLESGKGGFGIGLCTAREFARAMGGDLSVRANSPHGCIFTLSLPSAGVS